MPHKVKPLRIKSMKNAADEMQSIIDRWDDMANDPSVVMNSIVLMLLGRLHRLNAALAEAASKHK